MQPNNIASQHSKPLGIAGKMARLFVGNRELNVLSILFIVVWGLGSFFLIPKAYNPDIVAPAFTITTQFPGASVTEVQELVTKHVADAVNEMPGIDKLTTHSFDDGESVVMVQFNVGTSTENAKISLLQKLKDTANQQPLGASESTVVTMDPDDVPVLSIALTSDNRSPQALRALAFTMVDELKLVSGTSKTNVVGGLTNHLQIEIKSDALAHYHIAMNDIVAILQGSNGIYTAESLTQDEHTETIRVQGSIASVDDAQKIVIVPDQNAPVFLGDIATITEGPGEITNTVRITNKDGVANNATYITIAKLKGANISSVTGAVREKLTNIEQQPRFNGIHFSVQRDDGETAHDEISTLTKHLIISITIVVIILMAFLGLRNSLIVAISIPLTLLTSFGIGLLAGQTVNRITLFALILALGLLVDDAIVIIENIHRTLKNNPDKKKTDLIIQAVDEVGAGVFMSTITILLAFIPMAFVSGMMGPYMSPIPFFVSVTLLVSLFIAFTINPALTGILSSHTTEEKENIFIRGIHRIENKYASIIGILTTQKKKKNIILGIAVILLLLSLLLPIFRIVSFRMLPKADKEYFFLYVDMPAATTFIKTDAIAKEIEQATLQEPEIVSTESFIGTAPITDFNGLFKGSFMRSSENLSTIKVNLTPHTTRNETSEHIALQIRDVLQNNVLSHEGDVKLTVVEDPPGPPVQSTFLLKIQGDNQKLLTTTAQDLEQISRAIPGIVDLKTTIPERSFERQYSIDTEKAGRLGIVPATIIQTLHSTLSGVSVARYNASSQLNNQSSEQQNVIIRLQSQDRTNTQDLSRITVPSNQGIAIPLSELLINKPLAEESEIATDLREQVIYVSGEMGARSVMYAVLDLMPKLSTYHLRDTTGHITEQSLLGATYENAVGEKVSIHLDGEWKLTLDIFRDLGIAMGVALLMIYFVLAVQLRSLTIPLLIMATIPLALIGVLVGFAFLGAIKGTYFNATSMIGVIALAGIVVKNAIIYLAYLDELKEKGMELTEALMETGRVRLLPILLTSLTAILGSLTIIADPVWEGLAWAIIFGLSVSTLLTLIIFPLLYQTFIGKTWGKSTQTVNKK